MKMVCILEHLSSVEGFTGSSKTCWSQGTSVINNAHRLMALITRYANRLVLNNVLLDDGLSILVKS